MAKSVNSLLVWFSFSIFAALIFSFSALRVAWQSAYVIQDDARQHVFWMYRFVDPDLFAQDIIADYFQSVAPRGYTTLYRLFASIGVEPLLFNKILPAILGVVATAYCFGVCHQMFFVPLAGFMASLLLNQNLWLVDDLSSGTPRAFFTPLFLAFLYYLLKRSLLPCLITIVLQGLFYPHTAVISGGVLLMQLLSKPSSKNLRLCGTGIATAAIILLVYQAGSALDTVISAEEAKGLPEFLAGGRSAFFLDNSFAFWLTGERSGILPREWQYTLLFSFGCLLPLLKANLRFFPLAQKLNPKAIILIQVLVVSLGLFFLAHLVLFRLHLPSRYTQHSLRILIAIADGIFVTVILDSASQWIAQHQQLVQKKLVKGLVGIIVVNLLLLPSYYVAKAHPERLGYVVGEAPSLYQFFAEQPQDTLIASLTQEADFIPSFSQRSLLTAQEYSIPYHIDYYAQLRQRTQDTIEAQYSLSLSPVKETIEAYQIDFWLLAKDAFSPEYIYANPWLMQYQTAAKAAENLQQGQPALSELTEQCSVFEDRNYYVLTADCILAQ